MNLTELQNEVFLLTNRPDKADLTQSAIRAVTLKLHQKEYFYKDLLESGVTFPTPEFIQQVNYRTILPTFRALKYIRRLDTNTGTPAEFFDIVVPETVLDSFGAERVGVCYIAGNILQLKSHVSFTDVLLGCYLNPDVSVTGYNSWIALDHPWAIIYEAAAQVCKTIGKQEEEASYRLLAREQWEAMIVSNIQAQGY